MFVRYHRSVLRHDVCHKGWAHLGNGKVLAKFCQTNKFGNSAGFGPLAAARADHLKAGGGLVAAAQGSKRSHTLRRRPLKCSSQKCAGFVESKVLKGFGGEGPTECAIIKRH